MPVRTHERHQASLGGLNGSDASGRTLQTVRHEARRRSVEVRKRCGDRLRLSSRGGATHHAGNGAESRTQVALVCGVASSKVVVVSMLGARLRLRLVVVRPLCVATVVVRLLSQHNLGLHTRACDRAHHGSSQRAPQREQHCHEYQEPDAKRLHRS